MLRVTRRERLVVRDRCQAVAGLRLLSKKAGKPRGRLSTVSVRAIIQRRAADAGIEGRGSLTGVQAGC